MKIRKAHRFAGLIGLFLFAGLALTGILLNHSDRLGLAHRHVQQPWLLRLYGIQSSPIRQGFRAGDHWLVEADAQWYLDGKALEGTEALVGAVAVQGMILAATTEQLRLFLPDGTLVEQFEAPMQPLEKIGITPAGQAVVRGASGDRIADENLMGWQSYAGNAVWSRLQALPVELAEELSERHQGLGPTWERVLLDLHSGRLFGRYGWLLSDLAAILMLVLVASGLWSLRQRRRDPETPRSPYPPSGGWLRP